MAPVSTGSGLRGHRVESPEGYQQILGDTIVLIRDVRRQALATVNRALVCLYWHIGKTIAFQQEHGVWGDAVVDQLSTDLRSAFPDLKGLTKDNLFRMKKFYSACLDVDAWLSGDEGKLGALTPQFLPARSPEIVGALTPQFQNPDLLGTILSVSWSHLTITTGAVDGAAERYFYWRMAGWVSKSLSLDRFWLRQSDIFRSDFVAGGSDEGEVSRRLGARPQPRIQSWRIRHNYGTSCNERPSKHELLSCQVQ